MTAQSTSPTGSPGASSAERGTTRIGEAVVLKVASAAVRGVPGVHAVGGAGTRAAGVAVAVGADSAEVAVELVAEHGTSLPAVAESVRRSVAEAVRDLTGLRVGAVDVLVVDVHVPSHQDDDDGARSGGALPRTRTTAR
ncbi:MAG: Asp23/Gls24 family envelope stress response protein [Quadrisphaera sp.]